MAIKPEIEDQLAEGYRGRSVLITGADGFIGSHLADVLMAWGAQVYAFDLHPSGELRRLRHSLPNLLFRQVDLRERGQVQSAIAELPFCRGLIVFHLAAQAHVGDSWNAAETTLATNVLGTLNLLEAIRAAELELHRFVYAGSSEEYGCVIPEQRDHYVQRNGAVFLNESSPLNPQSIYATSKVAADFLTRNYGAAFGLPVVVGRMFNNFGPRQSPRYITGSVITQALARPLVELGWTHAKRDFTYVEDGVRGHLAIGLQGEVGATYVFGQGRTIAIGDWVKLILQVGQQRGIWDQKELIVSRERFRPGNTDAADLLADYSHISTSLGWQPAISWDEGLWRTIRWYAENRPFWQSLVDWS